MSVSVVGTADVSTEASDFQADGTAAPGSTGRVADAGHVHPATISEISYQVVSEDISIALDTSTTPPTIGPAPTSVTAVAPAGSKIVYGWIQWNNIPGVFTSTATLGYPGVPASDGSSMTWQLGNALQGLNDGDYGTAYAVCLSV